MQPRPLQDPGQVAIVDFLKDGVKLPALCLEDLGVPRPQELPVSEVPRQEDGALPSFRQLVQDGAPLDAGYPRGRLAGVSLQGQDLGTVQARF